jgi:hypothetical protein
MTTTDVAAPARSEGTESLASTWQKLGRNPLQVAIRCTKGGYVASAANGCESACNVPSVTRAAAKNASLWRQCTFPNSQERRITMLRFLTVLGACCVALNSCWLRAQDSSRDPPSMDFGSPVYAGETPFGASARGYGDLVRSFGVYNYLTSEAFLKYEEARQQYIRNRLDWASAYNEIRTRNRLFHQALYAARNPPKTQEDLNRYARDAAPKLLGNRLDAVTGYIAWPRLLYEPEFDALRRELEQLYAQRAKAQGAISNRNYSTILAKIQQMTDKLIAMVGDVPPQEYPPARNFLESLAYEIRRPTG